MSEPKLKPQYARAYGKHDFVAIGGKIVSVLSQPTWEEFWEQLSSGPSLGHIALSPELMTSPVPLDEIPSQRAEIMARVNQVKELSHDHPHTTIVLGTAAFDPKADKPANSLVFIQQGEVVAQRNKTYSLSPWEKRIFTMQQARHRDTIHPYLAALVCSDILGETTDISLYPNSALAARSDNPTPQQLVPDNAEIVLFSTCWAIPLIDDPAIDAIMSRETRFKSQLEGRIRRLFCARPLLKEVIVADRLASISGVSAPYNGRFTRAELQT